MLGGTCVGDFELRSASVTELYYIPEYISREQEITLVQQLRESKTPWTEVHTASAVIANVPSLGTCQSSFLCVTPAVGAPATKLRRGGGGQVGGLRFGESIQYVTEHAVGQGRRLSVGACCQWANSLLKWGSYLWPSNRVRITYSARRIGQQNPIGFSNDSHTKAVNCVRFCAQRILS
jgi:hypothetical protein